MISLHPATTSHIQADQLHHSSPPCPPPYDGHAPYTQSHRQCSTTQHPSVSHQEITKKGLFNNGEIVSVHFDKLFSNDRGNQHSALMEFVTCNTIQYVLQYDINECMI